MEDYTRLCMNCFHELNGAAVCPHCGYEQNTPQDADCLPPGTVIADRFLIGRARGQDETGIVYNVLDLKKNVRRRMREFFPPEDAARGADGSVGSASELVGGCVSGFAGVFRQPVKRPASRNIARNIAIHFFILAPPNKYLSQQSLFFSRTSTINIFVPIISLYKLLFNRVSKVTFHSIVSKVLENGQKWRYN